MPGTVLGSEETVNKFYPSFMLLYCYSVPGMKQHLFKTFLRENVIKSPKDISKYGALPHLHTAIYATHTNRITASMN